MARDEDNGFGEWGNYFEAKKLKLEEQFYVASDPFRKSTLFDGISIFVNGLVNPSADELKRIMMVHGGTYHHYERSHTKFIIASNLPDVKVRKMDTSKIINAQWVVDCVKNMRVLDYTPYLLYTNQKTTQPRLLFDKRKLNDSTVLEGQGAQGNVSVDKVKEVQEAADTSTGMNQANITNLSVQKKSALSAVNPEFLNEFYKNSRLHHIATLGASFKQYICEMRQEHGNKPFAKRSELRALLKCNENDITVMGTKRYVMHIDMDCFFVSVGLRKHPELIGLPVAVTHSKGGTAATEVPIHPQADRQAEQELFAKKFEQQLHDNIRADKVRNGFENKMSLSEIASCSYEARKMGIKNGMFVGQALKLCPDLKTIQYDFDGYREVASALYETVVQYTLNIEAVSCDEMFVELTDLVQDIQVDVMKIVGHIRQQVRDVTGCPCSAGVAGNKLLARMATKLAKPNGQYLLDTENAASYMASLALDQLPGVGSSMTYKLNQAGLFTCGEAQKASLISLETLLGKKVAQNIFNNCRGIDTRPLAYEQQRKSVSAEVNYGIRFTNYEELEKFLQQLSAEVHSRLIEIKRKAKSITLKLMVRATDAPIETSKYMGHGVCDNLTKSSLLKQGTDDVAVITSHVLKLMKESGFPPHELRGIGIHLSKLDESGEQKKENIIKNMFTKISEKQKDKPANAPVSCKTRIVSKQKPLNVNVLDFFKGTTVNKTGMPHILKGEASPHKKLSLEKKKGSKKPIETEIPNLTTAYKFGFGNTQPKKPQISVRCVPAQFDEGVLAQLPEDIRREILHNPEEFLRNSEGTKQRYETRKENEKNESNRIQRVLPCSRSPTLSTERQLKTMVTNVTPLNESDLQPSTSNAALNKEKKRVCRSDQIVSNYIHGLTQHMHPAILQYLRKTETIRVGASLPGAVKPTPGVPTPAKGTKQDNVLVDPNYKSMLANWVKSVDVPMPADVDLMFKHICYLVEDNKMDEVYEIMKYLCRLIKSKRAGSCRWHMAYNEIESNIQEKVHQVLDCHIYFTEAIDCFKCA